MSDPPKLFPKKQRMHKNMGDPKLAKLSEAQISAD
jgi:hypothetical protein